MFKKILIANRGEIALRIIRACKELGIATVAVHSEGDRQSLHVRAADEDVCIGPSDATRSYLDPTRIIAAAEVTGAEAIHPGYGFLAENARFADICTECDVVFIGPTGDMIRRMGDKAVAKQTMAEAGVPVIPGSDGPLDSLEQAVALADDMGYPVILKAVSGGGGKGIRYIDSADTLRSVYDIARNEARVSFSDDSLYLERFIDLARHIEVQLMGDSFGNVVHLGERDCTVQRRRQKLVEESPSPALSDELRKEICEAAARGAASIGYSNAGTIEFLLTGNGEYFFMEMNTRVQVEHPVSEMVSGVDIVREQIRVAAGMPLSCNQDDIVFNGHAIECRINAEDPELDFRPGPGTISEWHVPGGIGVRIDTHAYAGYVVPPYYDSMLAKIIVHASTRDEAIVRMRRALEEFYVDGVPTTIPFHMTVMNDSVFQNGVYTMNYVDEFMARRAEG
jgi:acetyl-CoA carboxylase, biotin carboxylase subunit